MSKKINTDWFLPFNRIMNFATWVSIFVAMLFFDKAKPETQTILDLHYAKSIRSSWNMEMATTSLWFFVAAASVSLIGLLINLAFLGDKKHHISYGLLIGMFISLAASFAYIFYLM